MSNKLFLLLFTFLLSVKILSLDKNSYVSMTEEEISSDAEESIDKKAKKLNKKLNKLKKHLPSDKDLYPPMTEEEVSSSSEEEVESITSVESEESSAEEPIKKHKKTHKKINKKVATGLEKNNKAARENNDLIKKNVIKKLDSNNTLTVAIADEIDSIKKIAEDIVEIGAKEESIKQLNDKIEELLLRNEYEEGRESITRLLEEVISDVKKNLSEAEQKKQVKLLLNKIKEQNKKLIKSISGGKEKELDQLIKKIKSKLSYQEEKISSLDEKVNSIIGSLGRFEQLIINIANHNYDNEEAIKNKKISKKNKKNKKDDSYYVQVETTDKEIVVTSNKKNKSEDYKYVVEEDLPSEKKSVVQENIEESNLKLSRLEKFALCCKRCLPCIYGHNIEEEYYLEEESEEEAITEDLEKLATAKDINKLYKKIKKINRQVKRNGGSICSNCLDDMTRCQACMGFTCDITKATAVIVVTALTIYLGIVVYNFTYTYVYTPLYPIGDWIYHAVDLCIRVGKKIAEEVEEKIEGDGVDVADEAKEIDLESAFEDIATFISKAVKEVVKTAKNNEIDPTSSDFVEDMGVVVQDTFGNITTSFDDIKSVFKDLGNLEEDVTGMFDNFEDLKKILCKIPLLSNTEACSGSSGSDDSGEPLGDVVDCISDPLACIG